MATWKCSVCGYATSNDTAPTGCPVCGAEQSNFFNTEAPKPTASSAPVETEAQSQWKCLVCGYIHTGPEPPDVCPVCGADKSKFVPVKTDPAPAAAKRFEVKPKQVHTGADERRHDASPDETPTGHSLHQILDRWDIITHLHGHPIAVHIPNGVLPLSFLFTLMAVVFKSDSFATAATYNIAFVALSMPVVVFTGFIDWYHRFNARWAKTFSIKLVCGVLVSALSMILAVMWLTQPAIHRDFSTRLIFFMALHMLNVITAAVAGYYGGKLVFRK
jgi:rubredoxin/uncharacterized membrane protein